MDERILWNTLASVFMLAAASMVIAAVYWAVMLEPRHCGGSFALAVVFSFCFAFTILGKDSPQ